MLTSEQINWLIPVFNEAYSILDDIPDLESTYYSRESRAVANYFTRESRDYEFFYDEDDGLYKVAHVERNEYSLDVYGNTNREIIRHILDGCINDDAYLSYASKRFWDIHPNSPLPCRPNDEYADQYNAFANERVNHCHNIVDPYIESIEECVLPPNPGNEPLILLKKGEHLSLFSRGGKHIVKVSIPEIRKYHCCHLRILRKEYGQYLGKSIYINHEKPTIDISMFFDDAEFLSLEVEFTLGSDEVLLERLDIDRK